MRAAADAGQPQAQQRNSRQQCYAAWPPLPTPEQVGQCGAEAASEIVEGHVESGGGRAGAAGDRAGLHGGCGLRYEDARRKNGQADDDDGQRFGQGKEQAGDHHGAIENDGVAKAEAIEKAARLRRDDGSEQIDEEDAAQLRRIQMERWRGQVEVRIGKAADQREERSRAHAEVGEQPRIAQMLPGMIENLLHMFGGHKILRQRKPRADQNAPIKSRTASTRKAARQCQCVAIMPERKRPRNPPTTVPAM